MKPFTLTPDQVTNFPIDRLGIAILEDLDANYEGKFHQTNWLNQAQSAEQYGGATSQQMLALAEAWAWIVNRGLVAPDPSQSTPGWYFVSRLGRKALEEGLGQVYSEERLQMHLHPRLEAKVRPQFLMGEYELAAFAAMREVEILVRELAGASTSEIGVKLMRNAFGENGPLRDQALDGGEQTATMELFAGAIGVFKNPSSHRQVEFGDPTHAAEVILLADLLIRMLESPLSPDVEAGGQ